MITREGAEELDDADELAFLRAEFLPIEDPGVVAYLDGNSLGRPPADVAERMRELVHEQWGTSLIRSWSRGWLELPEQLGDRIAEVCLGAGPGQTVLADSTSVCLYKALRAAARLRPGRTELVTDRGNFPTDRYLTESVAEELGLSVRYLDTVDEASLREVLNERTALVTLSHVDYRTAEIADMAAINTAVHECGALSVWDLCHSVGALPVRLEHSGTDFAVGCTYKFLNAGPGAPAFLFADARLHEAIEQPIRGWMSARDIFAMAPEYRAAEGIRRMVSGTPPILGLAGVAAGIELTARAGIERIRAKSLALTELAIQCHDAWLERLGYRLGTPRAPELRGGHVTVEHPSAERLAKRCGEAGVIVDFRAPNGIRIGPAALSTGYTELWDGMHRLRELS